MSEILAFSEALPIRMVITSWADQEVEELSSRQYKFFREFSLPGFDSFFQPFNSADGITIQFDSSFDLTNVVTLKDYYTDAIINTGAATEVDDRGTYKVWRRHVSITGLEGRYYVEVTGTDTDAETFNARSEPLSISANHCGTVLFFYGNDETAFGIDYESENISFKLRVPAFFNRTSDSSETELFKDSGGNSSLVSAQGTRARVLKASQLLPQWFIEKVNIALLHDVVIIDNEFVSSDESWSYELISDRKLWGEPEASIILASGSSDFYKYTRIMKRIELKIGDTGQLKIEHLDSSNNPIDITNYTSISFKIAKDLNVSNDNALFFATVLAVDFSNPAAGFHNLIIPEDVTKLWVAGDYMYQSRIIDASSIVVSEEIKQMTIKASLIDNEA